MTAIIVTINAGSSSIKFSLFCERGGALAAEVAGKAERLAGEGAPRLVAHSADGSIAAERTWPAWVNDFAAGSCDGAGRPCSSCRGHCSSAWRA